jgi:hypothetical protein
MSEAKISNKFKKKDILAERDGNRPNIDHQRDG